MVESDCLSDIEDLIHQFYSGMDEPRIMIFAAHSVHLRRITNVIARQ